LNDFGLVCFENAFEGNHFMRSEFCDGIKRLTTNGNGVASIWGRSSMDESAL
jgi:hypothetical protein